MSGFPTEPVDTEATDEPAMENMFCSTRVDMAEVDTASDLTLSGEKTFRTSLQELDRH